MVIIAVIAGGAFCAALSYLTLRIWAGRGLDKRLTAQAERNDLPLRSDRPIASWRRGLRTIIRSALPARWSWLEERLDYLGYSRVLCWQEYLLLVLLGGPVLAALVLVVLEYWQIWVFVGGSMFCSLGFLYWLEEKRKEKDRAILRDLPYVLDVLAACTRAGQSFDGALAQVITNLESVGLKPELERLSLDLSMGQGRVAALRSLAARVRLSEIRSFVMAVVQGEKMGTAIGELLEDQARAARQSQFLRLEGLAHQAPVKMLFPLILFIFPVVFIVLFFPLGMQLFSLLGGP